MSSFAGYGNANPGWDAMLSDWRAANPDATVRHGGGPGDVGFGPGVLPDWASGGFTPFQQQAVQAVANNPNLTHGWQASAIPQWQINGEYPGGSGWVPGVTPMPPGWAGQAAPQAATPPAPQGAHSAIPHLLAMIGALHDVLGRYDSDSKNPWGNDPPKWLHQGQGGGQGGGPWVGPPVHQPPTPPRFLGPPVRRPPGQ